MSVNVPENIIKSCAFYIKETRESVNKVYVNK